MVNEPVRLALLTPQPATGQDSGIISPTGHFHKTSVYVQP